MTAAIPRLRMFAGPNGSGKSTIKSVLRPELLGVYINPDEIERDIRRFGFLDLAVYGVETTRDEILSFFSASTLLAKADLLDAAHALSFAEQRLSFIAVPVNAYFAAVAADFLRQKLLVQRVTFTFETVMSSRDKVDLLCKAQQLGYRTYLYYVATEDPIINISRVKARVRRGGHSVLQSRLPVRQLKPSADLCR